MMPSIWACLSATKRNTARGRKTSLANATAGVDDERTRKTTLPLSTSSAATRKFFLPLLLPLGGRGDEIKLSVEAVPQLLELINPVVLLIRAAHERNQEKGVELPSHSQPPGLKLLKLHLLHLLLLQLPLLLLLLLLLLQQQVLLEEESEGGAVDTVVTAQRRHHLERSVSRGVPHGAVTPLRPGVKETTRPHPREWRLLCP